MYILMNHTTLQEQFNNKQNLNLLWDVLLDEFHINNANKNLLNNIKIVFESNINPFILKSNPRASIMELNKNFLSQVVLAVNRLFPNLKNQQTIKRITISNEEVIEPYKIEDIQSSRQSEFDKDLEQKRMDMENYLIPQKPKELDFSDKQLDSKITSMDSLISEKMAQRNLEIETLQNNFNTTDASNWLTPKETSLKNEKNTFEPKNVNNDENNKLKYLQLDNGNIKFLVNETNTSFQNTGTNSATNATTSKKVSWSDNDNFLDKKETVNIFSKLKKQLVTESTNIEKLSSDNNNNNNIDLKLDNEKQYLEQRSILLPSVKQEEIIRNKSTLIASNNEPVLPKTEIIKQLNEINNKIDNLYEIINKLTNLVENNNTKVFDFLHNINNINDVNNIISDIGSN